MTKETKIEVIQPTEKDESVKRQTRLKKVKQNMKLTGKSKEYINSLSRKGGSTIRKKRKSKTINKLDMLKDEPLVIEEQNEKYDITEIGDDVVVKDFKVILLKE